jgi:hypothetical protein
MKSANVYVDLDGNEFDLAKLDADERRLVARLRRRARTHPTWGDFDNFWMRQVAAFYDARGVPRRASRETAAYRIAEDLSSRLGIAAGLIRPDDYRHELERLIRTKFATHRAFCKAAGISKEALDDVLSGKNNLPLTTLTRALDRIGYTLHIAPAPRRRTG